jgi:muramoyltetrapeptide carboxypeptidase LdcA involved in peptidoglycan recycling
LFFEDRGERLYAIDRMLTYLKLAGIFQGVRGLVFGRMERVEADRHLSYGMEDVILDVLGDLGVPILYGFPAGHCPQSLTLPFGVQVAIQEAQLVLCESPVIAQDMPEGGGPLNWAVSSRQGNGVSKLPTQSQGGARAGT